MNKMKPSSCHSHLKNLRWSSLWFWLNCFTS